MHQIFHNWTLKSMSRLHSPGAQALTPGISREAEARAVLAKLPNKDYFYWQKFKKRIGRRDP
ncbi:MAG: hypothetical protein A4E57_02952 [Syntrophorhabdaceae bacterium PtaU1.Bin034]|nr:MAG: hypothetical protein A4E57_02952 [Syntrophorhabdaceae bacterium PtaU1.Bin034]